MADNEKALERHVLVACRIDEVAEWLRRWTANPLGSARVGSNPILLALWFYGVMVSTLDFESSDPSSNLGRTCFLSHLRYEGFPRKMEK